MGSEMKIAVLVIYAPRPRQVHEIALQVPPGTTVSQALAASGLTAEYPEIEAASLGIWGRKASGEQRLRAGDRIEVYRALRVDPKVARRERFARQGAGRTGLFAQRRAGAKAGY
jgi:putative ubiquitin-RnfH superfamily antitoxin RatB of RatAB toxin-antitoxin module